MPSVLTSFQRLFEIALLRRGPQDLPYSHTLLAFTALASLAATVAAHLLWPVAGSLGLFLMVFFGYTFAFFHGVLQMRDLTHRRVQTLTAVFGTDVIVTVAALPLFAAAGSSSAATPPLVTIGSLALTLWQLAVIAFILRHALSCGRGQAVLWAVAYWFGTQFLMMMLQGAG